RDRVDERWLADSGTAADARDEVRFLELHQLVAHGVGGEPQPAGQLLDGHRPVPQLLENSACRSIRWIDWRSHRLWNVQEAHRVEIELAVIGPDWGLPDPFSARCVEEVRALEFEPERDIAAEGRQRLRQANARGEIVTPGPRIDESLIAE